MKHPGWKHGEIQQWDKKSGQIQVVYEWMGNSHLYWAHLDDTLEIAEFATKTETQHTSTTTPPLGIFLYFSLHSY